MVPSQTLSCGTCLRKRLELSRAKLEGANYLVLKTAETSSRYSLEGANYLVLKTAETKAH